jgi:hypothetical protein
VDVPDKGVCLGSCSGLTPGDPCLVSDPNTEAAYCLETQDGNYCFYMCKVQQSSFSCPSSSMGCEIDPQDPDWGLCWP